MNQPTPFRGRRPGEALPPSLTRRGRATLLGGSLLLVVASTGGQPLLAAAGAFMLALVAAAWVGVRADQRDLGRLRLELMAQGGPSRTRGRRLPVMLTLEHRGRRPVTRVELHLRATGEPLIQASGEAERAASGLSIPARARGEITYDLTFPRAGHWHIHGVDFKVPGPLGLTLARRYQPCELALHIRPRRLPERPVERLIAVSGAPRERVGVHQNRMAGSGTELRELRDYVPGDALRSMAWRATARRQRPLVRAYEEESVRRLQILVDIGPTMRAAGATVRSLRPGGPPKAESAAQDEEPLAAEPGEKRTPSGGELEGPRLPEDTPLDRATDLAATIAELSVHDRLGLTTFDTRVYGHLEAGGGQPHLKRLLRHLIDLSRVVDADLTEIADSEVLARVGAFLEVQDGVALRRTGDDPQRPRTARTLADPLAEIYDTGALYSAVTTFLAQERERGHAALHGKMRPARDTLAARLRLFCALRGITLPYRLTGADREQGLAQAIGRCLGARGADDILILSDFRGLTLDGPAVRSLHLAAARHRQVTLVNLGGPLDRSLAAALRAARARLATG